MFPRHFAASTNLSPFSMLFSSHEIDFFMKIKHGLEEIAISQTIIRHCYNSPVLLA